VQYFFRIYKWNLNFGPLFPLSWFFSANQHFCWTHTDSFLTFPLLSMPKLLIFGHTQTHQNLSGNTAWGIICEVNSTQPTVTAVFFSTSTITQFASLSITPTSAGSSLFQLSSGLRQFLPLTCLCSSLFHDKLNKSTNDHPLPPPFAPFASNHTSSHDQPSTPQISHEVLHSFQLYNYTLPLRFLIEFRGLFTSCCAKLCSFFSTNQHNLVFKRITSPALKTSKLLAFPPPANRTLIHQGPTLAGNQNCWSIITLISLG